MMPDLLRFGILPSLLFAAVQAATAQNTGESLSATYGPPELERYTVSPDATLTVTYGRDRAVCQLALQPRPASHGVAATISAELADSLLNEWAPPGLLQGQARLMIEQMGCAAHKMENYDNVQISRSTNECAPLEKNVTSLVIRWKQAECPAP
jgi:hypothetical protein